jgi:competence protein ComEA
MLQMTRREQIGALVLAVLLVAGLFIRFALAPKPVGPVTIDPPNGNTIEEMEQTMTIVVHVAGAVNRPGVYTLPDGARVHDALKAAGGVLAEADPHALNLAEPLYDGRRVTVPLAEETEQQTGGATESDKVNINTATAVALEALPGIGPAKAAAILSHREKNGPFRTVEDLAQVPGIGAKTVDTLKDYITLY